MSRVFCLFLVFCLLPALPCASATLNGHFKSLNLYQQAFTTQDQDVWLSADSLRLDLTGHGQPFASTWQISMEQLLLYQDPQDSLPLPDRSQNRIESLAWNSNSADTLSWQLQVDRLNLHWGQADTVLTLGRQGIGFGRIGLFSPLDIIAPFAPTAIDNEVRPGIDALRMQHYFDIVGELGASVVFGERVDKSSFLADLTLNARQVDMLFISGQLRDRPMVGIGLAGQLGGLGWKGEWAGYQGSHTERAGGDLYEKFCISGVELDYRFANDLIVQLQYLYNGAGSNHPDKYPLIAQSAPLREGLSFLYGTHYLLSGFSRELSPLVRFSGLLILNLKDESWLFRPLLHWSLANNISLQIFWDFCRGDGPLLVAGQLVPRSEFGSSADAGGLLLKIYF